MIYLQGWSGPQPVCEQALITFMLYLWKILPVVSLPHQLFFVFEFWNFDLIFFVAGYWIIIILLFVAIIFVLLFWSFFWDASLYLYSFQCLCLSHCHQFSKELPHALDESGSGYEGGIISLSLSFSLVNLEISFYLFFKSRKFISRI